MTQIKRAELFKDYQNLKIKDLAAKYNKTPKTIWRWMKSSEMQEWIQANGFSLRKKGEKSILGKKQNPRKKRLIFID